MNNNKLIARTETGEELTFDIVAMVTNEVGARNMVFFTDNKVDGQGNRIVYASYYVIENGEIKLISDMTEDDFNNLKEAYEVLQYKEDDSETNQGSNVVNNPYTDIEVL